MQFIKSFSTVTREDYETVGYLASDLALVHENNFRIPLTFVISTEAYHTFLEKNGLKNKLIQLYHGVTTDKDLSEAYETVKKIFLEAELPSAFVEELFETYHSVGGSGESADSIINQSPNPRVMLIKSPNYILEDNDLSGVFLNVQGEEKLLKAVKLCWASLFSPESAGYRISNNIRIPENCGIIVQQFLTKGRNAVAKVFKKQIEAETYLGIMDTHEELHKDKFVIDKEYLQIREKNIRFQQHRITIEEGKLVRNPLKQDGAEQKLNDKEVMEAARTAKRISNYLNKNSTVHMTLLNDQFLVKLCYRNTSPEPLEYEEPTVKEEKTIVQMKEEVEEFEETPQGEITETEIAVEEEVPEEETVEFVSFDETETTRPEEIVEEVEVYEQSSPEIYGEYPKEEVFAESKPYEEEVSSYEEPEEEVKPYGEEKTYGYAEEEVKPYIEEKEEEYIPFNNDLEETKIEDDSEEESDDFIGSEPEIDDFIMPMDEAKVEVYEEPKIEIIPEEESKIMEHIRFDASSIIVKVYKELSEGIKRKYDKTFGTAPESFGEGVRDLSQKFDLSEQDLMEVKRLRDDYLNNNKALTSGEIKFVLDTANKALNVLIK